MTALTSLRENKELSWHDTYSSVFDTFLDPVHFDYTKIENDECGTSISSSSPVIRKPVETLLPVEGYWSSIESRMSQRLRNPETRKEKMLSFATDGDANIVKSPLQHACLGRVPSMSQESPGLLCLHTGETVPENLPDGELSRMSTQFSDNDYARLSNDNDRYESTNSTACSWADQYTKDAPKQQSEWKGSKFRHRHDLCQVVSSETTQLHQLGSWSNLSPGSSEIIHSSQSMLIPETASYQHYCTSLLMSPCQSPRGLSYGMTEQHMPWCLDTNRLEIRSREADSEKGFFLDTSSNLEDSRFKSNCSPSCQKEEGIVRYGSSMEPWEDFSITARPCLLPRPPYKGHGSETCGILMQYPSNNWMDSGVNRQQNFNQTEAYQEQAIVDDTSASSREDTQAFSDWSSSVPVPLRKRHLRSISMPLSSQDAHQNSCKHTSRHHRRNKTTNPGASARLSHPHHAITPSIGFINYTPDDSYKILTGVAPSGSSKTKARRDKENAERKRQLSRVVG